MRQGISTADAPKAVGPYSQGVRMGNMVFVSGQVAIDPATGVMVTDDIGAMTRQIFKNVGAILATAGLSYEHVARTTVYLADMNDFAAMNAVYAEFFTSPAPARSTIQVARLPLDARIEIDIIAVG
jgi:2-iminobutanoate/2-iminopropanoate deaminase